MRQKIASFSFSYRTGPDPRIRHSVWGCVIGGMFNWLPNCCNQSAIQRISSVQTKKHARM
jgi:hypothetical protein